MHAGSLRRGRFCSTRIRRGSRGARDSLSTGRRSPPISRCPSSSPAAWTRRTSAVRCVKSGRGPWTFRAAWSRAAASRTRGRSSNSFGACDVKMQGNPPDWEHYSLPDAGGHFGPYGGVFVAETLRAALDELTLAYSECREDPEFRKELDYELEHFVGRPSPIFHARRLSGELGG